MNNSSATRAAAAIGGFALLATGITAAILVSGGSTPAGAAELERFESCEAIAAWTEDVAPAPATDVAVDGGGLDRESADSATGAPAPAAAGGAAAGTASQSEDTAAPASGEAGDGDTGGTNTVVEGVDEIDIVDRLDGGRALVSRNGALSVVDLSGPAVLSSIDGLPYDARISVAGDVVWVAGNGDDGSGVDVRRLRLAGDALEADGEWRSPGYLVDARRTEGGLHVVAVDQPGVPGVIPFADGAVPCDQVWHPEAGADTPAATLLVTLRTEGALAPTAAAEVVGSGSGFLVTGDAAYVTTQTWNTTPVTGVHRFDLATLTPTGSGSVPGTVPGPFGLNEHDGHLRIATTEQGEIFVGGVEGGPAIDIGRPVPAPGSAGPLAEVFVLDLDGALDVVGRTGRFGHDGEAIHGVRFVGDTAYVVTFLQTDPFWVLDMSNPTAPTVVGELEIPGFSAYLHPVDDTHVVGFGPDGAGRIAARLFNVSDPTQPSVVDELTLGDDSPVVWDHHALIALGEGRLAVPVSDYPDVVSDQCGPGPVPAPLPTEPVPTEPLPTEPVPEPLPTEPLPVEPDPRPIDPGTGGGSVGSPGAPALPPEQICEPIFSGGSTGVAVLAAEGDDLVLVDERSLTSDGSFTAERVLPAPEDHWVFLGWDRLVDPEGGEVVLPAGAFGGTGVGGGVVEG